MARACKQPRLTSHMSGASSSMAENYEAFVSESTYLSRQIYKSQRRRALCLEGGDPVAVEDAETKRWAMGLGTIVAEAELPAKKIADQHGWQRQYRISNLLHWANFWADRSLMNLGCTLDPFPNFAFTGHTTTSSLGRRKTAAGTPVQQQHILRDSAVQLQNF